MRKLYKREEVSRQLAVFLILLFAGSTYGEQSTIATLPMKLGNGGYVIVMRHASAPRELPDAKDAGLDNPKHERQLDATGRSSAREMGEAFRRLRIPVGTILSSPTYRALETIKLAELGQASAVPELGDSGQSMMTEKSGERGTWLRLKVADLPAPGTNTLIVTHLPNISEAYPMEAQGLSDGEALIFQPDGHGAARLVSRVKIDEWAKLDADQGPR